MSEICGKTVFRYKRLPFMVAWVVIVTVLLIFLGIQAEKQSGLTAEWVIFFGTAFAVLICWQGGLVILGASDIVIDDNGISRALFGMTWASISWKNMSRILCFEVYYARRHANVMAYNLFPKVKPRIRLFPSGKVWITGNFKGVDALRDMMNKYALEYGIQIQNKKNGNVTTIDRLI